MQADTARPGKPHAAQEQHRPYRIERHFSTQRPLREFVRDLLRAHSGE